jgi:hypothetical protein
VLQAAECDVNKKWQVTLWDKRGSKKESQLAKGSWADKYKEGVFAEISTKDAIRKSSQATFMLSMDTNM